MKRYEYKNIKINTLGSSIMDDQDKILDFLNEEGEDGWECYGEEQLRTYTYVFKFKRELEE